ncbi:hypothetical protein WMY93_023309 [Mugilogobius chulae]|uniref:Rho-GAP domain-containing protein n=1 Tax=Mugilogobius chulae TaxID=88201 RepID=A0AAW0N6Z4_9GOBI
MGESWEVMQERLSLYLQKISMEQVSMNTELEFLELAKSFEVIRRRCLSVESELKKYKELLVKSDVAKAALDVKLKHVRNQLDLEMQKRLRVERDFQYLQRQMQLMCDILVQDFRSTSCLNDEQKSLLATFEQKNQTSTIHRTSKRLSVIDESSFLSHSDISYDRTDDDVDLDTTVIKPLKSRARERRRSSMGVLSTANGLTGKRLRTNVSTEIQTQIQNRSPLEKEVETIVKTSVLTPESAQIHMVVGITQEKLDQNQESRMAHDLAPVDADQTSVWCPSEDTIEPETETRTEDFYRSNSSSSTFSNICCRTPVRTSDSARVVLLLWQENAFWKGGSEVQKLQSCGSSECKSKCSRHLLLSRTYCVRNSNQTRTPDQTGHIGELLSHRGSRVPLVVMECIAEIERRGLKERGLYRVPGDLHLGKVDDVHVICGLLKDFLRKLPEPLVTFRLHPLFMEAAELEDDSGTVILYKAISDLPSPNKDTMAIIFLHLHKVMASAECHMDHSNLCRVFGPTLIGHALAEPSPSTIMRDTASQHKVMSRLLSIPVDYWKRVLAQTDQTLKSTSENASCVKMTNQNEGPSRLFKPLTSPELNSYKNQQGSIKGRLRNLGHVGNVTTCTLDFAMECVVKLTNQSQGRDRIFRTTQYACALSRYLLRNHSNRKELAAKLKSLESNMSAGRKLFRLGNTLNAIDAAKRTMQITDPVLCLSLTAANLSRALYFICDNLLWLRNVGLIRDINKECWNLQASRCYLFSLTMNLIRDAYVIGQLMVQRARDKDFKRKMDAHLSESPEVAEAVVPQLDALLFILLQIVKSHPAVALDTLKNMCDLFIPMDKLGIYQSNAGVVGFCGLMSSVIGIVTLVQPNLKIKP